MASYVLAYDLGTSGVKGALVTMTGEVAYTATASYPLYTPAPAEAEQEPLDYWQGVCRVTKAVLQKGSVAPDAIGGIAFGTMWKGIIPVDGAGNVLSRSIIWLDSRSVEETALLNARFGEGTFSASDYWPKLYWLRRHRPEVIAQAETIFEVNSYLKWKATGVAMMDISNAFVSSFDEKLDRFYAAVLDFADIPREKFPPVSNSRDFVGRVTETAAAEMGLVAGIPVFGGNSDINAIAVGGGTAAVGGVHIYFGSSGWIGYTVPHEAKELYISPFDRKRDVAIFALQAIGLSFNWAVERFYSAEKERLGDRVFAFVDEELAALPAGSEGVFATPWFYGERPPLFGVEARGNFLGLGAEHDRRHMTKAVMEGVCYQLKMGALYNAAHKGYTLPSVINVIGGGSCSSLWMQMLADVLNVTVQVPADTRHAGAVGTAYSALLGLGVCPNYEEVAKRVRIERVYTPIPENVQTYESGFKVFEGLYRALQPIFRQKQT